MFWILAAVAAGHVPCEAQDARLAAPEPAGVRVAEGVLEIGRLANPRLNECSGIIASRQFPGIFWVHNDGGGSKRQVLYAVSRTGQDRGEFRLVDGLLDDWEDIAIDDQRHLYMGDIGNNDARRNEVAVHQVDEPDPSASSGLLKIKNTWRLRYPGAAFDAEALFIWQGHGYIVSKVLKDARAEIYRFSLSPSPRPVTLEFVARTKIESPVTGADISADGKRLALVAKSGAFVFSIDGDVSRAHKEKGAQTKFRHDSIEGCTFVPEGLLAVAESREIFLFTYPQLED